jgi:EAL domain-containing protein (putative c-di-GMP-specific phosphodiesterase class I)
VSIGIACYPAHGTNAGDLLRNADMALYQAKADGGDVCRTFDESMNASQQELYAIEQGLRQALELRQFELNYQPIVETGSGRIIACETLLRWRHPERGLIPPMDFIGLAESLGLIIPIGYWVFEAACTEANHWPATIAISINLSPVQFRDENLFDTLSDIMRRTQFSPERLILEITEGVLLEDSSHVIGIMNRLRALGIRISLDDFGTGHSGFGYLRQFPLDGIKIDKVFVRDMEHQPQARAIVTAVLTVATALGLGVVAEGVENGAQLAALRQLGCRYVQGYFTGRPKAQMEIKTLLKENQREIVKA